METQFPVLCSSKPLKPELEKFQRIPITSDVFKLGRGRRNTVVMPYKCLSKDHCIFKKVDDDWILENCSYSSIKVNGSKVRRGQKRKLRDQDIIKLESSNEFVYMFNKNSTVRKRRKVDSETVKKKPEEPSTPTEDTDVKTSEKQRDHVMLEVSRKEKQIQNEYAGRIEKLKGSKRSVKRHKALLRVRRDAQLASVRVEIAGKMASLMKLKELEIEKLTRENELQEELDKLNKKLAEQIEMHESEKRRTEQLLTQQQEQKAEPSSGDTMDMESELQCSICSELFVRATTLGCSHSFCQYCIRKWHSNKRECPICRTPIRSECRSIVLDSLVEKMAGTSEEAKKKRQELLKSREELESRDAIAESSRVTSNTFPNYEVSPESRGYYEDNSDSNSSYYGRESSLEPDPDILVPMDDDDESDSSNVFSMSHLDDDPDNLETSPEFDSDGEGEISADNYDERDSSPENDHSAPENYEGETSAPENYDEGEISAPENYDEGDMSAPENYEEEEMSAPENYDEGEMSAPENYDEGEMSAPENYDEGEMSAPENYDEGEMSAPENYEEGEMSAPENYEEGEISEPEYEHDSAPDFDDDGENSEHYDNDDEDDYY